MKQLSVAGAKGHRNRHGEAPREGTKLRALWDRLRQAPGEPIETADLYSTKPGLHNAMSQLRITYGLDVACIDHGRNHRGRYVLAGEFVGRDYHDFTKPQQEGDMRHAGTETFKLVGVRGEDGRTRPVVRFECQDCPATLDINHVSSRPVNGEALIKDARHRGWSADHFTATNNRCPACLAKRKSRPHDVNSALRNFQPQPIPPTITPEEPPMPPPTPLHQPTAEQRAKLRDALALSFDEAGGFYIEGASDASIAAEIGVAEAIVERAREVLYGPIRVTAAEMANRRLLQDLKAQLDAFEQTHSVAMRELRARIAAAEQQQSAAA